MFSLYDKNTYKNKLITPNTIMTKEQENFTKELIAFAQERGFVWGPSPEIYGGLSGFYTYAPLGKLLKNNVEDTIRRVFQQHDFWEVECPIIAPASVWQASGHLGGFTDPLVKDVDGGVHRADHLIEEALTKKGIDPAPILAKNPDLQTLIDEHNVVAPNGKALQKGIINHNLMLRTNISLDTEAYNRPETATTTYLPFTRYFDYFRKKLPFGVFQIGKAFRNEISPRQFILRMREFTQAEGQLFIFKDQKNNYDGYNKVKDDVLPFWPYTHQDSNKQPEQVTIAQARENGWLNNDAYAYTLALSYKLFLSVGIPKELIRLRQHGPDEKAFYADDAWDIEVQLKSFGWMEMCGIHDRTDYDLSQHQEHSKKKLVVSDETHKQELPHILEIAFGVDRMVFVLLDTLYNPQEISEGKNTFHIAAHIAPIKAAVYPLVKKDGMPEIAQELYNQINQVLVCIYDQSGSIGRRYLRAAEQGIPYSITIDQQTLEDNTVTIRDRDTQEQERVAKDDIVSELQKRISTSKLF